MRSARLAVAALLAGSGCSLLGLYDTPPAGDCLEPFRVCGEDCVDLENDAENCGDCEMGCRPDQICDTECVCRPGLVECEEGSCIDITSNPRHCGQCDNACPAGCEDMACVNECSETMEACDGACVDLQTDPLHCGSCSLACAEDQICIAGQRRDYRPALSEDCDTADCDEEEVCCIVHTAEVCVSELTSEAECPAL